MPKTKYKVPFIVKAITIRKDQADFIEKNTLNLSKFVQQKLDERMNNKKE